MQPLMKKGRSGIVTLLLVILLVAALIFGLEWMGSEQEVTMLEQAVDNPVVGGK